MDLCVVTGAAGFIGSRLAGRLVQEGFRVRGVDCFTDYYPRARKEANLRPLRGDARFQLVEGDLNDLPLGEVLAGARWVFHQAAQAGVRASWGETFRSYTHHNIDATQRLLEACLRTGPERVVYASSSSVYGDVERLPVSEEDLPRPNSPYGVTKLAAEHLCRLYQRNGGLHTVSLRYFTVYGPGQRPDMAFCRFLTAMIRGEDFDVYGDGEQTRDFTYVDDAVTANLLAALHGGAGEVYNIGGGHRVSLREVLAIMESVTGLAARPRFTGRQRGDVLHTHSDAAKAARELGFAPASPLEEGVLAEYRWLRETAGAS
jgi:UDP-glucose 4-epimerase